ncbi:uncharacterized protein BX664DRAFT_324182 [Halteromyces radiatus]|uniref:uncharacterized protein n=1 Tax=Halteromyces radiatus TaxID=101107 RepID=UPI0022209FCD|nr:uncharacterized protein BX664DRAFT_324182 [Halteromyces radiatus]KAI8096523.1 hypothetical protein BX664DRAFT_324182 [Halteromyces radiatus]
MFRCTIQHYAIIRQHYSTTANVRSPSLLHRLKKDRPDLKAIMEPRHTKKWAQSVIQSRWKTWVHTSKARYIATSLFDMDANQFSELANDFVKAGSRGQIASCIPSALLANCDYTNISMKELTEMIDRRFLAAFYDHTLPFLPASVQDLKSICQFSSITWFPHTRAIERNIFIHIYDDLPSQLPKYNETGTTTTSLTIYCGNKSIPKSTSRDIIQVDLIHLDDILQQHPTPQTLVLDTDGHSHQRDWRWTKAWLNTPASTIHIRTNIGNSINTAYNNGFISALENICKQRGEKCTVMDHRQDKSRDIIGGERGGVFSIALQDIQHGDCVVVSTKNSLVDIKDRLEHDHGLECVILYPQLPEAIQMRQIEIFNDTIPPSKVLLMTDTVSLPYQVQVKRLLIKSAMKKHQHNQTTFMPTSKLRRIIGTIRPSQGITVQDRCDLPFIGQALMSLSSSVIPKEPFAVLPTKDILKSFCQSMPSRISMSSKMDVFEILADVDGDFSMSSWKNQMMIIKWLELYQLSFDDQWFFMNSPVDVTLASSKKTLQKFGELVVLKKPCELDDILGSTPSSIESEILSSLVNQYHIMDWYNWFKLRYPTIFVTDETLVRKKQDQYQTRIEELLGCMTTQLTDRRKKLRQGRNMEKEAGLLLLQSSSRTRRK